MIRLSKSTITEQDKLAVMAVLEKEFLGMGSKVQEFENALESFFGRPVVTVSNGTAALQLAISGCGIGPGDEVLVPSLTYLASFQAVSATGAIPIACDIDDTLHLDPAKLEEHINSNTKAIMPVHYGGSSTSRAIYKVANKYSLRVIEDAAHAFGSTANEGKIGSFGDIVCFSFDGIKNITSGEGGCIVTSDTKCVERTKDLRLLGVHKDSEQRYKGNRSWNFDVTEQGWRYHMSDLMAALGISQLSRFEEIARLRKKIAKNYDCILDSIGNITLIKQDRENVVPHLYTVLLDSKIDRDGLRIKLEKAGIQTGVHYFPNHLLTFYRKKNQHPLPVTEALYPRLLSLPLHLDLTESDQSYIADTLQKCLK